MIRKVTAKQKYNLISPEDVDTDKVLSFSFNPDEQPLFEKFYKMRLNNLADWSRQQNQILNSLKYCKVYCVVECSRKGRLHYHGVIKITNVIEFYLMDLKKLMHYGSLEIDQINDLDKWVIYYTKQENYMKKFCERNDMLYEIGEIDDIY